MLHKHDVQEVIRKHVWVNGMIVQSLVSLLRPRDGYRSLTDDTGSTLISLFSRKEKNHKILVTQRVSIAIQ